MPRADLLALAARIEAEPEGSRELDEYVEGRTAFMSHPRPGVVVFMEAVPPITTSLDIVMAIIRERLPGWIVDTLSDQASGVAENMKAFGGFCRLTNGAASVEANAKDLTLALLAAALRAIAQGEGE